MRLLPILAAGCFVSSMSMRLIDPVVPDISRDLGVDAASVALLASVFAFPYALGQPVLGALGDAFGKARIIKIALAALVLCLLASAAAPNLDVRFAPIDSARLPPNRLRISSTLAITPPPQRREPGHPAPCRKSGR